MKVFIIYGKSRKESELLCDFIQSLGHELVVLEQLPGKGRTIIEKLQDAPADKAIALLSGDDKVKGYKASKDRKCPRQNVLFEYGYFMAKLGRSNIIEVRVGNVNVDLLSDCAGIEHIIFDKKGKWKDKLAKELRERK